MSDEIAKGRIVEYHALQKIFRHSDFQIQTELMASCCQAAVFPNAFVGHGL